MVGFFRILLSCTTSTFHALCALNEIRVFGHFFVKSGLWIVQSACAKLYWSVSLFAVTWKTRQSQRILTEVRNACCETPTFWRAIFHSLTFALLNQANEMLRHEIAERTAQHFHFESVFQWKSWWHSMWTLTKRHWMHTLSSFAQNGTNSRLETMQQFLFFALQLLFNLLCTKTTSRGSVNFDLDQIALWIHKCNILFGAIVYCVKFHQMACSQKWFFSAILDIRLQENLRQHAEAGFPVWRPTTAGPQQAAGHGFPRGDHREKDFAHWRQPKSSGFDMR